MMKLQLLVFDPETFLFVSCQICIENTPKQDGKYIGFC